jgi:hypothetical protein
MPKLRGMLFYWRKPISDPVMPQGYKESNKALAGSNDKPSYTQCLPIITVSDGE